MANSRTNISAAPTAVANGYVVSTNMKLGAYTLAASAPPFGARRVTVTRTVVATADTPGTIEVVGKDLSGQTISESIAVGATGVPVSSVKFYASVTSLTGVGWVLDGVEGTPDTIVMGWGADNAVATGTGTLAGVVVNTTAAGAIVIADAGGTIATLKASIAEGYYGPFDVAWGGFLSVTPAAGSDVTVLHSGSSPESYA